MISIYFGGLDDLIISYPCLKIHYGMRRCYFEADKYYLPVNPLAVVRNLPEPDAALGMVFGSRQVLFAR